MGHMTITVPLWGWFFIIIWGSVWCFYCSAAK